MNDKEIIEATAEFWVSLGGDREGLEWCQVQIAEAIGRIQSAEYRRFLNTIANNARVIYREKGEYDKASEL
jgi:hypothetical protein